MGFSSFCSRVSFLVLIVFISLGAILRTPRLSVIGDTVWIGEATNGASFFLELNSDGTAVYIDDKAKLSNTVQLNKGIWTLVRATIQIRIPGRSITLTGEVEGERMGGSGMTGKRERWAWSAVQEPMPVTSVAPNYPTLEAVARISGDVIVDVDIEASGGVLKGDAISGHPSLRRLSEVAAKQWTFSLADGVRVRKARLIFSFRLVDKPDTEVVRSSFLSAYRVEIRHGIPAIDTAVK